MDEKIRERFTHGLPIPPLNELQQQLAAEIVRLEQLARNVAARRWNTGADADIFRAGDKLAAAMQDLGLPRDEEGETVRPYDCDDSAAEQAYHALRQPFDDVEAWILREGSGTGSARSLAVCYLAKVLGLTLDWKDACVGLDQERTGLAQRMLGAKVPIHLPNGFWQIFVSYRERAAEEWERQGFKRAS